MEKDNWDLFCEGSSASIEYNENAFVIWHYQATSNKYVYMQRANWGVDTEKFDANFKKLKDIEILCHQTLGKDRISLAFIYSNAAVYVSLFNQTFWIRVASQSKENNEKIIKKIKDIFPKRTLPEEQEAEVSFWTYSSHGPEKFVRKVSVPKWEEITYNYNEDVKAELQRLVEWKEPAKGGQLILWHGLPGTGKTFALRSLGWEWREWCELHYIVDPDVFFGGRSDYMMEVILGSTDYYDYPDKADDSKWRLLILEDTGELLNQESKEKTGQGFSRLLNVVDGFIGQGLKVLILVTTNDELSKMHPAVVRPGRCLSNTAFNKLSEEEVKEWAKVNNLEDVPGGAHTVADLYARLHKVEAPVKKKVGFGFGTTNV